MGDARAQAVLAVLAGASRSEVADRYGIHEGLLDRWVETFIQAGSRALAEGIAEPETRSEQRDRYLGLIAHELRSPLAMIQGWTDLLGAANEEPEVVLQARDGIARQTVRLRRLAEDALDATSVALGRLELETEPVWLGEAVSGIIAARSLALPDIDIAEDVRVAMDRDRFGQILDNLLENARKHAGRATGVRVGRRGMFGEVVVSSTGDPIDRETARRMFEPFERGSTTASGVGLGLYVCRSLMVAHGGQIGLRVDDDGNHFWLRLPLLHPDDEES